jgi:hypothetical protein
MPKTYEHTFQDLHSGPDAPTQSVVDLGPDPQVQTDPTGRVKLNDAPGNPDKGKPDQFGDIERPVRGADVDDGIDVELDADPDAEPAEGAADADGDGDDLKGLSKNVRERIERERRMRQEAEARQQRTEAELAAVSRKVDLQAKESEWKTADEKADEEITKLRERKVKAIEEGNSVEVESLDDKITDLKADKRTRNAERERLRDEAKKAPAQPVVVNPKAQAWIDAHPKYGTDPLFKKAALAADQALNAMGLNSQSDEYYVELSKILAKGRFAQDIDQRYLRGGKGPTRGGPRGTGSNGIQRGSNGGVKRGANGRTSVVVTASDKMLLAQMGQDPDDPAVIKAFAREKLADAQKEAAERGER